MINPLFTLVPPDINYEQENRRLLFLGELLSYFDDYYFLYGDQIILSGKLKLDNGKDIKSKQRVHSSIIIQNDVPLSMPRLFAYASWLKREVDWHCYANGELCWELEERWNDKVKYALQNNKDEVLIIKDCATWFLNSVISLLSRHWYAHCHDIEAWPKEWQHWEHGRKGIDEYEKRKYSHRVKRRL